MLTLVNDIVEGISGVDSRVFCWAAVSLFGSRLGDVATALKVLTLLFVPGNKDVNVFDVKVLSGKTVRAVFLKVKAGLEIGTCLRAEL